ncbi:MAG TPA: ATP-binding protein [Streptosporangiaceae bacterium]
MTRVPAPSARAFALDHADSSRLLDRQAAVLELLASGAPLPKVLTSVVDALEEMMPGARCSILLLEPGTGTLRHGAAPSLPASYASAIDGLVIAADAGSCGTAAYTAAPVVAEDITTDPRWDRYRALALPHGLRSCWSTPISDRTGIAGTFAVYYAEPHRPTPREERLIERVTHLASIAIEHDRLFGALAESEERFRHAFEDSAAGMALTDTGGRFVKVNAALADMLATSQAELLDTSIGAMLQRAAPGGVDHVALLADVAAARRESAQFDADARRPDGTTVRVAVVASAVRGAAGVPVHLSLNIQDLTQRQVAERERRARREAEIAYQIAEAASRAKSSFLTALSHELRTPLQAISGFAELLGTLDLPAERRQAALDHIAGATAHVISLVDDVLDIATVEAGALPLHPGPVAAGPLVQEVLDLLGPLAGERGIELHRLQADVVVRADSRRLRQVLINLVTNAIRYNVPDGQVRVQAVRRDQEAVITVTDTGPGIEAESLNRVFISFDRLSVDADQIPGAGLGLPLARGLTEAMGGALLLSSEPGAGTTATVMLPAWSDAAG